MLAALVQQAGERIHVAVGGGLRLQNAAMLARITGATHFHGSLQPGKTETKHAKVPESDAESIAPRANLDPGAVRKMIKRLQEA